MQREPKAEEIKIFEKLIDKFKATTEKDRLILKNKKPLPLDQRLNYYGGQYDPETQLHIRAIQNELRILEQKRLEEQNKITGRLNHDPFGYGGMMDDFNRDPINIPRIINNPNINRLHRYQVPNPLPRRYNDYFNQQLGQ